jgi:DNA-directed RNA polymerase specialized sigma24 family protein
MYLIPPMDDDPPPEFVDAVAAHERELRHEALRLTGGDPIGYEIYQEALIDLAGHWRRLHLWGRLTQTDAPYLYLRKRLTKRTKAWRDDQVYEVEIRVLPTQKRRSVQVGGPAASIAFRKAAVLDGTARAGLLTLADAAVAWCHASRRSEHHRIARLVIGGFLLVGGMVQSMSWLATTGT